MRSHHMLSHMYARCLRSGMEDSVHIAQPIKRHSCNPPSGHVPPQPPHWSHKLWRTQHSHAKSWSLCASVRSFVSAPSLGAASTAHSGSKRGRAVKPILSYLPSLARRWRPPSTFRSCLSMAMLRLDSFTLSAPSFDASMVPRGFDVLIS